MSVTPTPVDELGVVPEGETPEEALRRVERENDKASHVAWQPRHYLTKLQLRDQVAALQALLAVRPPAERLVELEKERQGLELLLQGTQRENERAMLEVERCVARACVRIYRAE